uniref:Uncharacterized protein n=1 Tax=virus sp. ctuZj11 TaxID=2825825 RepID=A0A8S5RB90_9VIRU|nr:MAG TPA: hypothetical protein [virus sp. ctuZj11]
MIVDKHKKPVIPDDHPATSPDTPLSPEEELFEGNPMADIYRALESIIKGIKSDPSDPESEPYFRTVKWNTGQVNRIKSNRGNDEYGSIAFPAVFIHFINTRGLVQTSRIGEFRGEVRIQYVLNRLNMEDDEYQTEGVEVFQMINNAINTQKNKFSALTERFQFTYWDQPESFSEGLQQYWITYDAWFRDYSAYAYKDYVEVYVVAPPFTNHSDQNDTANPDRHEDHKYPEMDEAAGIDDL